MFFLLHIPECFHYLLYIPENRYYLCVHTWRRGTDAAQNLAEGSAEKMGQKNIKAGPLTQWMIFLEILESIFPVDARVFQICNQLNIATATKPARKASGPTYSFHLWMGNALFKLVLSFKRISLNFSFPIPQKAKFSDTYRGKKWAWHVGGHRGPEDRCFGMGQYYTGVRLGDRSSRYSILKLRDVIPIR